MSHHTPRLEDLLFTRRDFLNRCGMGMGGLALGSILGNAMGGERHYFTSMRAHFPEYARELDESASFAALPAAVRRDIAVAPVCARHACRLGIRRDVGLGCGTLRRSF